MTKSSSSANLSLPATTTTTHPQRTSKRRLSPSIVVTVEKPSPKRSRQRAQRSKPAAAAAAASSSTTVIQLDDEDDDEQENDDDEEDDDDGDDNDADTLPIKSESASNPRSSKQRQASSGSIEYVQTLSNEPSPGTPSLNNIENIKAKAKMNDDEIVLCRSPPAGRKGNHSKAVVNGNGARKSNVPQVRSLERRPTSRSRLFAPF